MIQFIFVFQLLKPSNTWNRYIVHMKHFTEPAFQCFSYHQKKEPSVYHLRILTTISIAIVIKIAPTWKSCMQIFCCTVRFLVVSVVFRFRGILLSLCRGWPNIDAVYAILKMRHSLINSHANSAQKKSNSTQNLSA